MRVPKEQLSLISQQVKQIFPEAKVYLFGSRVDDNKKGGDIDILVLSLSHLGIEQKMQIKSAFFEKYGEQKIDIVSFTFDDSDPFKELILLDAVEV